MPVKMVTLKSGVEDINQEDMFFKLLVLAHDITIRFPKVVLDYELRYGFESMSGSIIISTPWRLCYRIETIAPSSQSVKYSVEDRNAVGDNFNNRFLENKDYRFDRLVKLFMKDFAIKYKDWFKE